MISTLFWPVSNVSSSPTSSQNRVASIVHTRKKAIPSRIRGKISKTKATHLNQTLPGRIFFDSAYCARAAISSALSAVS